MVRPVSSMRHDPKRNVLEGTLRQYIREIEERGKKASIYKDFYSDFTDEEFRRLIDPNHLGFG